MAATSPALGAGGAGSADGADSADGAGSSAGPAGGIDTPGAPDAHADTALGATLTDAAAPARRTAGDGLIGAGLAHFRIDRKLGQGGMGEVYLATDLSLDRPVAIKILPQHIAHDRGLRERFYREARAQARLQHPNVCPIHFIGEHDGHTFFAMEYIEGESLKEVLERTTTVPVARALEYCRMAAMGLREAHAHGFTHRDIKPSNLMLDRHGVVKIVDFGLVKQTGRTGAADGSGDPSASGPASASASASGSESASSSAPAPASPESSLGPASTAVGDVAGTAIVGTPLYMAPEQAQGRAVDIRSDIYSLGATLHQLVSGQPPFAGDSVEDLRSQHASEERPQLAGRRRELAAVDALCDRMMAKRPDDRYQDYDELIAAMDSVSTVRTRPAGFWVRAVALQIDLLVSLVFAVPLMLLIPAPIDEFVGHLGLFAYWTVCHGRWGRTAGKAMFELQLVRFMEAGPIGYPRAAGRFVAQWGPFVLLASINDALAMAGLTVPGLEGAFSVIVLGYVVVNVVVAWRSPNRRALWDRFAGTQVCYRTSARFRGVGA